MYFCDSFEYRHADLFKQLPIGAPGNSPALLFLHLLAIGDPTLHPFPLISRGVVGLLAALQDQGSGWAFMDTHPASETLAGIEGCGFTQLICGRSEILEPQRLNGTALHTEAACLAGGRIDFYTVVRKIVAFGVLQHVVGFEEGAGTFAAITDRLRALLPVGYGVDKACVCGQMEDVLGFLPGDSPGQAIFHKVMGQLPEVEAYVYRVVAHRSVRVHPLSLPAGTLADGKEILGFHKARHVFVRQDSARTMASTVTGPMDIFGQAGVLWNQIAGIRQSYGSGKEDCLGSGFEAFASFCEHKVPPAKTHR
jgi:hypothetical protein